MTRPSSSVSVRGVADALLFVLGFLGATWEIFFDHSSNIYVYALIVVLLRIGREFSEVIAAIRGGK